MRRLCASAALLRRSRSRPSSRVRSFPGRCRSSRRFARWWDRKDFAVARVLVEIPRVGLVMETARVQRWLKDVGDNIAQGEPLVEVETEKTVVEIEAPVGGR